MSNIAYIGGVVRTPVYFENEFLNVELSVFRADLAKVETITVIAVSKDVVSRAVKEIHEGDYFLTTSAYLKTKTYLREKELECSECYNVEYQKVKSEKTEVVFDDFVIIKLMEDAPMPFGINKIFLSGNICNSLNYREKADKGYCKYKLAVNKKVFDTETEYPFIVTFGKDAELSNKYLAKNSRVFVEGSIQQREINQNVDFVCPECGTQAIKKVPNIVREVITSNVVFLDKKEDD